MLGCQPLITELEQRIQALASDQCPVLLGELERLKAIAWAKALNPVPSISSKVPEVQDRYLTVPEVAQRFGVTEKWLYRHKAQMPHSQPSRKVLLFPERAIERWFAARKS